MVAQVNARSNWVHPHIQPMDLNESTMDPSRSTQKGLILLFSIFLISELEFGKNSFTVMFAQKNQLFDMIELSNIPNMIKFTMT